MRIQIKVRASNARVWTFFQSNREPLEGFEARETPSEL